MSVEELAEFLVHDGVEEDTEYGPEDEPYTIVHYCWATPFKIYPYYWNYDEVVEDTIEKLNMMIE